MENINMYKDKVNCCGCAACVNTCPKGAIKLKEDEHGFCYPEINYNLCVKCGLCKKACNYQKKSNLKEVQKTYVAALNDKKLIKNSASGGVFAAIASQILKNKGIVVGCAWINFNGKLNSQHIIVDSENDLYKLQGSKYVQSDTSGIYKLVKDYLESDKIVLFSGTPCQVDGLYGFLKNKEYPNLYTVDIICHGTPNSRFFNDYLETFDKKIKGKITEFKFRDKTDSWGLKGKINYLDFQGRKHYKKIPVQLSSYYSLFLNAEIYRINCYSCKYANKNRIGNITIGDYWGIEKVHPEYLQENGGEIDVSYGVSCLMINDNKGKNIIEKYGRDLLLKESDIDKVLKQNEQLSRPCKIGKNREKIMNIYEKEGYMGVDNWYYKNMGIKKYVYIVWNFIPRKIQIIIKKIRK